LGNKASNLNGNGDTGAFSVSPSMIRIVSDYIEHQTEHHSKRMFDEEFLALLRKAGVKFDEAEALG